MSWDVREAPPEKLLASTEPANCEEATAYAGTVQAQHAEAQHVRELGYYGTPEMLIPLMNAYEDSKTESAWEKAEKICGRPLQREPRKRR